jgi:hypothetical protein
MFFQSLAGKNYFSHKTPTRQVVKNNNTSLHEVCGTDEGGENEDPRLVGLDATGHELLPYHRHR